ncbi:MAG: flagellar protein [Spirochaetales bacterium]|nr:flagellar protein [Spirochaetales bacterium]
MKRFGLIVLVILLSMGVPLFADTSVLLDFATLTPDTDFGENEATVVDFSEQAGTGFSEEERNAMKTSLSIENWEVELASSSRTVDNMRRSMTKAVMVNEDAAKYGGQSVMGIRVYFPEEPFNSWALISPPFEIPAFMRKTVMQPDGTLVEDESDLRGSKFDGYGVVKNIGVLKSISVNMYGSNYPNGFALILKDQNNIEQQVFMSYLEFDGWRELTWNNPNYITEVRNREINRYPLYPHAETMRKLVGMVFYKDSTQDGGDFIAYIKDITVTYDKASVETQRDISEEEIWGILNEREQSRRTAEFSKLGTMQVLRYLESKKMHQDSEQQ